MNSLVAHINAIKKNGFVLIPNALTNYEIEKIKRIASSNYDAGMNDERLDKGTKFYPCDLKSFITKFAKFEFNKFLQGFFFLRITKNLKLNKIANSFFNEESIPIMIHSYYTRIQNSDIRPWHTDRSYEYVDGKNTLETINTNKKVNFISPDFTILKFFFYLTPVGPKNGCTSYLPGSHAITRAVRDCIYKNKIEYKSFRKLEDLLDLVNYENNFNHIANELGSEIDLINFVKEANVLVKNEDHGKKFDFEANAGDLLVFDDGGIHRGSKNLINDRLVLRILYRMRKFSNF